MTIYLVTSGEYSDYHIDAVFADKEKAERFCALKNNEYNDYNEYEIEEWEEDDVEIDTVSELRNMWIGCFDQHGNLMRTVVQPTFSKEKFVKQNSWFLYNRYSAVVFVSTTRKTTAQKAEKILCDHYAKWKYGQMMEEV